MNFGDLRTIFNCGVNIGIFMNYADIDFGYLWNNEVSSLVNSSILGEQDAPYSVNNVTATSVVKEGTNHALRRTTG